MPLRGWDGEWVVPLPEVLLLEVLPEVEVLSEVAELPEVVELWDAGLWKGLLQMKGGLMEKRLPVVALLRKGEGALLLGELCMVSIAGLMQTVSIAGLLQMVSAGGCRVGQWWPVCCWAWRMYLGCPVPSCPPNPASYMQTGWAVVGVPQLLQLSPGSPR